MTTQLPHDPVSSTADLPPAQPAATAAAVMTQASLDELRGELEQLRRRVRVEMAQRLREVRAFGGGSNNDEFHAIREEQMVLEARIAALEETISRATVVDPADAKRGVAVIGSTVLVEDLDSGALSQYRLVSAHNALGPDSVSAGSPMGRALVGAMRGIVVTVDLPNGRSRRVRVADVTGNGEAGALPNAAA